MANNNLSGPLPNFTDAMPALADAGFAKQLGLEGNSFNVCSIPYDYSFVPQNYSYCHVGGWCTGCTPQWVGCVAVPDTTNGAQPFFAPARSYSIWYILIGAVGGGLVLIVLILVAVILMRRARTNRLRASNSDSYE